MSLDMRGASEAGARVFRSQPLITLGDILAQAGRAAEAEQHYREALAIHQEHATGNVLAIAYAQLALSKALLAQERVGEARAFALQAEQTAREKLGGEHPLLRPISEQLTKIEATRTAQ